MPACPGAPGYARTAGRGRSASELRVPPALCSAAALSSPNVGFCARSDISALSGKQSWTQPHQLEPLLQGLDVGHDLHAVSETESVESLL